MSKLTNILFSINSLRKILGNVLFYRSTKFNFHRQIIEDEESLFSDKKILVLAPHPDDDCFGVGGTIKKVSFSNKVEVAYFCDGSGGVKENSKGNDTNLIEIRKKEVIASGKILGLQAQTFFGYADGHLAPGQGVVRALSGLIKRFEPDIIFVPSFLDNQPDHRATNEILFKCLEDAANWSKKATWRGIAEIWAYEVWTPIFPNRLVMISKNIEIKKQAIEAQTSQLKTRGYDKAILGLNQYRAEINGEEGFAEAFFAATPEIYKELFKKS